MLLGLTLQVLSVRGIDRCTGWVSFGRLWGVLAVSLWRPRLGHPRLGLDLAKLGKTWLNWAKLGWNGWKWLETAWNGWNGWKLPEMTEMAGNG